ncbi:hypothetical protein E9529_18185 [Blastococcus sp. KM273128]|uniref:hypothetical protein n=1 Tax=Blastococcus sp. KM273128 TaxID=2570314 RepID=UPI001F2B388E|nr:hypothetical protein [Blastococcus sp. KM273128]MCF6746165.1 hypothetical protein [Blastococcus sp. KM273128]
MIELTLAARWAGPDHEKSEGDREKSEDGEDGQNSVLNVWKQPSSVHRYLFEVASRFSSNELDDDYFTPWPNKDGLRELSLLAA